MRKYVGKWFLHQFMMEETRLHSYLPHTDSLNIQSFSNFLGNYQEVFLKPSSSSQGIGVVYVTFIAKDIYKIHKGYSQEIFHGNIANLYHYLKEKVLIKKHYLIQEKIDLAQIDDSPIDIRVMVQRKKNDLEWVITGKLAKVAAKGFVTTNAAVKLLSIAEVTNKLNVNRLPINKLTTNKLEQEIENLSLLLVKHLHSYFTDIHTFGLDIGIDNKGKIWIIEANIYPVIIMFDNVEDKLMIQKILEYRRTITTNSVHFTKKNI
ncbi:YheC/YheD family protein [Bacillaceae bacterium IKA-2]|nr:YheC/YheD family protein [Bacillaceae bacterium IKA-2]